jgi:hypothetical protein
MIFLDKLPEKLKNSVAPFVIATIPLFIFSLFGIFFLMPVVVALTAIVVYFLVQRMDEILFSFDPQKARMAVTIPLCTFISIWAFTLAIVGRGKMLNGIVGPYCLILLIACAPSYRWKSNRKKRLVPTIISMSLAGILSFIAACYYAT